MNNDTKLCSNCKRDIPAANYVMHHVHCARNLAACPACKEPVPVGDLPDHTARLHTLAPCAQCGELVRGSDLEDHVRDSCADTLRPCRFCSLELPRKKLPAHESYCGARTECCAECGEWVMMRYRQLHRDSNHGFIKLDEDPDPRPRRIEAPKPSLATPSPQPNTDVVSPATNTTNGSGALMPTEERPRSIFDGFYESRIEPRLANPHVVEAYHQNGAGGQRHVERPREHTESLHRGAVKKRLAPRAPRLAPPAPPAPRGPAAAARDAALHSALTRQRDEAQRRRQQNQQRAVMGLPPILTPLEKLEKLRKMDRVQNWETEERDYRSTLQGQCWKTADSSPGHILGIYQPESDFKPMTEEEFLIRMQSLELGTDGATAPREVRQNGHGERNGDRMSGIKSSLRELRRGLNEVTAPYNNSSPAVNNTQVREPSPVRLPCEFCGAPQPPEALLLHQSGCRPESPGAAAAVARDVTPPRDVIPCEFCTETLPLHLIHYHQEMCQANNRLFYPD